MMRMTSAQSFFDGSLRRRLRVSVLGVDPFDEPNVTESKQNTKKLLDGFEHSGDLGVS